MIVDVVIRLLSFIVYIFLINFFFASWSPSKTPYKDFFIFGALTILVVGNAVFIPEIISPFINIVITILLIGTTAKQHRVPLKETYFWIVVLLAVDFICESLSLALFNSLLSPQFDTQSFLFVVMTTSVTMVIEILLLLGIKLLFFRNSLYEPPLTFSSLFTLSAIPIVSIIVLLCFLLARLNGGILSSYFALIIVFGILFMNICVLYLYDSLTRNLRQINQMALQTKAMTAELKYIKEIEKSQQALKSIRHDLKNQFIVLLGLVEEGDTNGAEDYLRRSVKKITTQQNFFTHDVVLNYLLNEKAEYAKKNGINFKIKVFLSENTRIDRDILAILIGNLVDNALAAVDRLADDKSKEVNLVIRQRQNDLLIDISNQFDLQERQVRQQRQEAGLGIRNIKKLVESNGGLYKQWIENNVYCVSIILLNI
ncbi:sensor histidine kinase [Pediococcus siamensis]|uniref:sensor histidine kinase n=1 Tax=Pediococcus siamensis TaxID=381829 RepID=UPI0039A29F89